VLERWRLAVLLCLLPLAAAIGADKIMYGPPPAWIKPVTRPVSDGSRPQAPTRMLLHSRQIRFGASTSEVYVESYLLVQTPQGLTGMGSIALPWKPDTDVLTVHKFQVLRGDKVIDILANGQSFEVLRRENNLEYLALDGILTAVIQPNGLEVGDTVNLAFSQRREDRLLNAPEFQIGELDDLTEGRVDLDVSWEKGIPLRWRATDELKGLKETHEGNLVELSWSGTDIGTLEQVKGAPLRFWKERRIDVGFFRTWNEISARLAPLYVKAVTLEPDSPLRVEARRIADSTADPVARLEETLKLAQDRVRYVYLGMNEGNLTPASADLTWTRRFGDCKGKSALIVALLREMKIEADPVAVNTGAGEVVESRLPMVGLFNHVIVRARIGGKAYWLDGAKSSAWRRTDMTTPNYISGLPVMTPGSGLLAMRAEPLTEPLFDDHTRIDASKGIHVPAPFHAELKMRGDYAATFNAQLASLNAGDLDRWQREFWKARYDFVTVKSTKAAYDEKSGVEILEMDGEAVMDWSGESYATDIPRLGTSQEFVRKEGPGLDLPYRIPFPMYSRSSQRIVLPNGGKGFSVGGKKYDQVVAGTHYFREWNIEAGAFTGTATTRTILPEIPAAEAKPAQKFINDIFKDQLEIKLDNYRLTDDDLTAIRAKEYTRAVDLIWRAGVLFSRNDWEGAIKDYTSALALDSERDNYAAMTNLGVSYYWSRKYDDAKREFERALQRKPGDAGALRGLGAVALAKNELDESIVKLTESLGVDPNNEFALTHRAYAWLRKEQPDKALVDSAAAIRQNPSKIELYQFRAGVFAQREEVNLALKEADALSTTNLKDPAAQMAAAYLYHAHGRTKEAVALMDRAIELSPIDIYYFARASVRERNDFAARLADADAALAVSPDSGYVIAAKARIQAESGDHAAAAANYSKALEMKTSAYKQREIRTRRGIEYEKTDQNELAQKDYAAALADDPKASDFNNFCWELALARASLEQALAACERAVALEPKAANYIDSKAFVLFQLGRIADSIASYDAAIAIRPKSAPSLYVRGMARNRKCGCKEGDADITAARRLSPRVDREFEGTGVAP
jgi:tetratricopeptide (TPR) repeat protein